MPRARAEQDSRKLRRMKARLNARRNGFQDYGAGRKDVQFGEQGKLFLHKPGSQNRKK